MSRRRRGRRKHPAWVSLSGPKAILHTRLFVQILQAGGPKQRSAVLLQPQGPSLEDYVESLPEQDQQKVVSRLSVMSSKRRCNDPARHLPGTVFYHEGHRHVKSGQQRRGTALRAVGEDKAFNAKLCRIVPSGGLVYL